MDVHRRDACGRLSQHRNRKLDDGISLGVIPERRGARSLHCEEHVAGISDRGGEGPVLFWVDRRIVESDVERDDARVQGAEGAKKVRVRLVRERIPAVLGDRGIVEGDDGYLIADGRVPEVDGLVVDRGLKRRVEELTSQKEGADGQCEDRQAGDDEPLARVALRKHPARLLMQVGVRLCGRSLG